MMDEICEWTSAGSWCGYRLWDTECGKNHIFAFEDGVPSKNEFKFCPYCGRKLVEKVERE